MTTLPPPDPKFAGSLTGDAAVQAITDAIGEPADPNQCKICRAEIKVMTFKGTGGCCTQHHKVLDHEWTLDKLHAVEQDLTREDGIK